jgi:hypothetical protein
LRLVRASFEDPDMLMRLCALRFDFALHKPGPTGAREEPAKELANQVVTQDARAIQDQMREQPVDWQDGKVIANL